MKREAEAPVTFLPAGRTAYVLVGTSLIEAAAEAGVILDSPCGGQGTCGKCRVMLQFQAGELTKAEKKLFSADEIQSGCRLACQTKVLGPTEVVVPESSLLADKHQILAHTEKTAQGPVEDPSVLKRYFSFPPAELNDFASDLPRLKQILGPFDIDMALIRELPYRLRQWNYCGTAVMSEGRLLDFEIGDTAAEKFAVAFDIGTTTLAAMLLDFNTAREVAVASRLNPQASFGDDVLSRILFVREKSHGLQTLHESIIRASNEMIAELCGQAGVGRDKIYAAAFSGNTAMQHLLCRMDASSLGEAPFVPAASFGMTTNASELGLRINNRGRAYVLPIIGGFVGGDTVAGILATELADLPGPALFVDIGTNGEIVLWAGGKLTAASTAAGPAFEGARITCGMRGSQGAIEKVLVDGHLRMNVIGNVAPAGLCGSGLIDVAAELLRHKILTPQGNLLAPDKLPGDLLPDLRRRINVEDGQTAFLLASEEESATGMRLAISQRDFRELQLAAGAIRAGTEILLKRAGLKPQDLQEVLVAGGFGNFIRRGNAQRIGLLPYKVEHHKIRYCGNTSLYGARLAALSARARRMAEDIARKTEHVDLAADADFQDAFAEAMVFPKD
jgi:uncharacterized 2Fe-2S/4Fe-4S cluster protein (DUF4445 family)